MIVVRAVTVTELENHWPTGQAEKTRAKLSSVMFLGSRSSWVENTDWPDSAVTSMTHSGNAITTETTTASTTRSVRPTRARPRRDIGPGVRTVAAGRSSAPCCAVTAISVSLLVPRSRDHVPGAVRAPLHDGEDQGQHEDHHADRGAVALVAGRAERHLVRPGAEHLGAGAGAPVGQDEDRVEDLEAVDHVHDDQEERRRSDQRHGDEPEPLPAVRA